MAWTNPTTQSTGTLITATIWNTDIVDNLTALRSGSVALTSQATGDVIYASSSTQLGRVAIGTSGYVLTSNGSAPAWSNTPTLTGTNFTGIPASGVSSGTFAGSTAAVFGGTLAWGGGSAISSSGAVALLAGAAFTGPVSIANATGTNELAFTGTDFTNILSATTAGMQFGITGATGDLAFITNNTTRMTISSAGAATFSGYIAGSYSGNLWMQATGSNIFMIDSDNNSTGEAFYFRKNASGSGGTDLMSLTEAGDLSINATSKLYFDGGSDTYLTEGSANAISFYAGGVNIFGVNSDGPFVIAGKKLFLDSGGDSYIAETAANVVRIYAGGTDAVIAKSDGLYLGLVPTTASAANMYYNTSTARVEYSTSSLRYKHDIDTLDADHTLSAVMAMRPVTYRGKTDDDQRRYVGFIAEEVMEIAPLLATYDEGGETGTPNYVTYDRVTAYLVAVVQKQQAEINALKARIQ